ncbi:DUF4834 family protein [Lacinutrix salivirga]
MGILRTLIIIALIYYGIKILSKLFAPYLFKQVVKKAEKKFGQQFEGFKNQQPPKKEGEITIDKMPQRKSSNKKVGDYVDFEEIE